MKQVIHDEGSRPIKIWTDEVEASALVQLRNLATLPFIAGNGVACMPDVHAGIGSTIGTVIATDKAIIPAAVGVDIGCFAGETAVFLADGKDYRIDELADRSEPFAVYGCLPSGDVVAAFATAKKTREGAPLVAVTLDNGERVRCTPDHEFQLRDGSYRKAEQLDVGCSLMPFYREIDPEGYLRIKQNRTGYWQRAHWIVGRSGLMGKVPGFQGQKTIIHHKDFSEPNNDPKNLQFMGNKDHSAFHRGIVDRNTHWQSPAFEATRKKALRDLANTEDGRAMMAKRGTANITKHMAENKEKWLASVAENGERGKPYLEAYNSSDAGRKKSSENARRLQSVPRTCPDCGIEMLGHLNVLAHRRRDHGLHHNHKVISVETLIEKEDVYCLTVPDVGNFALTAGVFVHNCGMNAVRLSLKASDLPDSLAAIRHQIERDVPLGSAGHAADRLPDANLFNFRKAASVFSKLTGKYDSLKMLDKAQAQLGSLGSGNHFIELCLDENQDVWIMLHSGSRGIGNMIGTYFIEKAKRRMEQYFITLPDGNLAYFPEDTDDFNDYVEAVNWAQDYALDNRRVMMESVIADLRRHIPVEFTITHEAVNCHHNYVERENHFGRNLWVTRKGAIRAREGDLGIIPGARGAKSYIVRGKGNPEAYCSCSHGAGRTMSRAEARRRFTHADLIEQSAGIECDTDVALVDEIRAAYKDIDVVMENQKDLVEIVHTLTAVLNIKGK